MITLLIINRDTINDKSIKFQKRNSLYIEVTPEDFQENGPALSLYLDMCPSRRKREMPLGQGNNTIRDIFCLRITPR